MATKKKTTARKGAAARKGAKPSREAPAAKPVARKTSKPARQASPAPRGEGGLVYTSALRELLAKRLGR